MSGSGISRAVCKSAPRSWSVNITVQYCSQLTSRQHPTTQFFYRPDGCPSCRRTNSDKPEGTHYRSPRGALILQTMMTTTTITVLLPLFRSTRASRHLQLRTGGFFTGAILNTIWTKNIHDDLSSLDLGICEARDLVQNRPLCRPTSLHSATHS